MKNRLFLAISLVLLTFCSQLNAQVEVTNFGDIPTNSLAPSRWANYQWKDPGNWTTIDVTKKGIKPGSDANIAPILQKLIDNGSGNRIFKFPAGNFNIKSNLEIKKNNIQIIGAGNSTKFLASGGEYSPTIRIRGSRSENYTLSKNASRGDDKITLSSSKGLSSGNYIILEQNGDGPRGDKESQIVKITSKSGNTLTLDTKIGIPFYSSKAKVQRFGSPQNVKLSNFNFERTSKPKLTSDNKRSHNIELINARNVEISNIESNKAFSTHITLSRSTEVVIKNNYVHGNFGGSGGTGGGITMNFCSKIYVLNNRTSDIRHHIVTQFGTDHCVIAYNRAEAPYKSYQDIGQHNSKGCHNNLFEGNFGRQIFDDNNTKKGWGTRYTMFFRNHATEIIGVQHGSANDNNIIGNELKSSSQSSVIAKGKNNFVGANTFGINKEGGSGNLVWKDLKSGAKLPASMFLKNKPSYAARWPLYGPKATNTGGNPTPPTPTPTPSGGPDGYTYATDEGGTVNVSGTVNIAYGANGKFEFLKNVSSNTPCNNATFGDPISGVKKSCYIQQVSTIDGGTVASTNNQTAITTTTGDGVADVVKFKNTTTSSASYRYLITDENGNILTTETSSHDFEGASVGICKVYGIAYQGNLSVGGKNVKDSGLATGAFEVSSNAIVVTRIAKTTTPTPPSGGPDGYTYASDEGSTVNVSGTVNIAYGANGEFEFLENVSANTPCNNAIFGDPIFGVKKSCYIQQVSTTNPTPTPTPSTGNCAFGTPTSGKLPSFDRANYTNIFVLGDGPNMSNIRRLRISWNAGSNELTQFAFNTANGNPSYYVDLRGKIEQKFSSINPSVKITGSQIGVDGDYWVTKRGNDFVMASKDGKFSIYCSANSSKPSCTGQKAALQEIAITLYPNPAQETLNISGLTAENAQATISDLLGKTVFTTSLTKDQNSLDVHQLKPGIYFISIIQDNGFITQKRFVVK